MKPYFVVAAKNLPVKPPISFTLVMWLILDKYHYPRDFTGIACMLIAIMWVVVIVAISAEKHVSIEQLLEREQRAQLDKAQLGKKIAATP